MSLIETSQVKELDEKFAKCQGYDIRELTIAKAHQLFKSGKLSSSSLTKCYLKRIEHLNPHLNAILEVNPEALEIAEGLDDYFNKENRFKGNLHGIPILLKDNIGTLDKMNTTAGSWAMLGVQPKDDAEVVKLLREAGAIILGKANLSEWAGFRSSNNTMGWSGRGGRTKNPYVLSETTAGSSSGSAAAVAANLTLVSLGSETDGSIIGPAHYCSVVGFKPSIGFVSSKGVIPLAPSQDSVGALTRTVEDNIQVTFAIAGTELRQTLKPLLSISNYSKPLRAGILLEPYFNDKDLPLEQKAAIFNLFKSLPNRGVNISIVKANFTSIERDRELFVMGTEFKHYLNNYLAEQVKPSETQPKSLQDIIKFNTQFHSEDLQLFDQSLLEFAQNSATIDNPKYLISLEQNQKAARTTIDALLSNYEVDVLIGPSYLKMALAASTPPAVAGYPIINIPVGLDSFGVPFGIAIYGPRGSEPDLLRTGKIVETFRPRPLPSFKP